MIIDKVLYERITRKKKRLDSLKPLSEAVLAKLRENFSIELAYNSNAIEGNTLTLRETRLVIEEGLAIKGKPLREHFEAINHQKAFEYMESILKGKDISEETIKRIHKMILNEINNEHAGRYRDANVKITGAAKVPPRFERVPGRMSEFVVYVNSNPEKLNDIELASMIHYRFVEIHPFIDGNGRCARLLMNLFLMRRGYPVTMILKVDRKKYYDRLRKADRGDIKPLVDFTGRNVERSLDLYLDSFERGGGFLSLAEAAKGTCYSQEYLSLLARKGRIEAHKIGRNWFIKRQALEKYIKSRKR